MELDNHSGKWQFFQILRFFRKIVRSKCDLHLELYLSTLPLSGSRDSFNEWPNTSRHKLTRPWTSIRITFLNWISASPSRPKAKVPRYPTVINPGLPTPPETPEAPTDNAPEVEPAAVIFESVSSGFSSSSEKQFQVANLLEGKDVWHRLTRNPPLFPNHSTFKYNFVASIFNQKLPFRF